jgi:MFS family permease
MDKSAQFTQMTIAQQSLNAGPAPSEQSLRAFDGVNFFVGGALAGFGPFVTVFLGEQDWRQADIGFVLTVGGVAGLLAQYPSGELLDAARSKRLVLGLGISVVGLSALIMGVWPTYAVVLIALVLQGVTGGFVGLSIPAVSLGLVGQPALAERLGRNQRFQSAGSLAAAGLMGALGYALSNRVIFFAAALLAVPALVALTRIRSAEVDYGRSVGVPDHHKQTAPTRARRAMLWTDRSLLTFATCLFLFQMANASILPLIGGTLSHHVGRYSSLSMSVLVIVPQILVVFAAPWIGRQAQNWGRRPLLLVGFGALPVRALILTLTTDPALVVAAQLLDGISATVLGVLQPLIIADLTGRTGRFNLAQGFVGTFSGVGASLSTTLSGLIAGNFGLTAGFVVITAIALFALLVAWGLLPETRQPA